MIKAIRVNNYHIKVFFFVLFVLCLFIDFFIPLLFGCELKGLIVILYWLFSFLYTLVFLCVPEIYSALFFKVEVSESQILISDYLPKVLLRFPNKQQIDIYKITSVFYSSYDLKSSIRSSRFLFNKKSIFYNYILSKNNNITKYLVLKLHGDRNAYIRYFWCLSKEDRKELIDYLLKMNKEIVSRL